MISESIFICYKSIHVFAFGFASGKCSAFLTCVSFLLSSLEELLATACTGFMRLINFPKSIPCDNATSNSNSDGCLEPSPPAIVLVENKNKFHV